MFYKNDSQNKTHKNVPQKGYTKWDSQKYYTKIIHKIRGRKMFHKKDTKNETHKNITQ